MNPYLRRVGTIASGELEQGQSMALYGKLSEGSLCLGFKAVMAPTIKCIWSEMTNLQYCLIIAFQWKLKIMQRRQAESA